MKRIAVLALVMTLVGSACAGAGKSEDPKQALISAMEATGRSEGLAFTLTIQSTSESLDALARDNGGSGMEPEDADKLLNSSITVRSKGEGTEGSFEMVVNVAGEDDFEMKAVANTLYLRADIEGLIETFGGDPAQISAAVQQAEAQGLTFVRPAVEGQWVSIQGLDEAQQQITGQSPPPVPEQQELVRELTESFEKNASVTSEGGEDAGEHLVVLVPLQETYQQFLDDFANLGARLPIGQLPDISEVPDEDVRFDVWVEDERVSRLEFDLLQIADIAEGEEVPEGVEQLGFRADIEEFTDEVEAPDDAVAIDPQQIFALLGGLFMGAAGPAMEEGEAGVLPPGNDIGAQFNCDDLQGAPPEVIQQFAEECPELQP